MGSSEFYFKRLHSLSGFFLLGFLCIHFFINSFATEGGSAFNRAASFMQNLPFLPYLEITLLGVPIAFHGIYGLIIFYRGKGNLMRYSYFRNWMYFLQKISGVTLLVFLLLHVYNTRIGGALLGLKVDYEWMNNYFADGFLFMITLLGVIAASFHAANGFWSFLINAGISTGKRAQKVLAWIFGFVFGASLLGSITVLFSFVQ